MLPPKVTKAGNKATGVSEIALRYRNLLLMTLVLGGESRLESCMVPTMYPLKRNSKFWVLEDPVRGHFDHWRFSFLCLQYISVLMAKSNFYLVTNVITTKSLAIFSFHLNPYSSSGQSILTSGLSFQVGPSSCSESKKQQYAIRSPDPENQRYDLITGPQAGIYRDILSPMEGRTIWWPAFRYFSDTVLVSALTCPIVVTARPLCLIGMVYHLYCPLAAT